MKLPHFLTGHKYEFIVPGLPAVRCTVCNKHTTIGRLRMFD
jgi:hypothetical protein